MMRRLLPGRHALVGAAAVAAEARRWGIGRLTHELMEDTPGLPSDISPIPPVGQTPGIVVVGPAGPNAIQPRLKVLPLAIVEEVPLPPVVLTEIELLMLSWHQEHAKNVFIMTMITRAAIALVMTVFLTTLYYANRNYQRRMKGTDNIPEKMNIGAVVYFDILQAGLSEGRIVIGLMNEACPLMCEAFLRKCTSNGGKGESFAGSRLVAMIPTAALMFGDGINATHQVPGYNPRWLPSESSTKPWRGAISSIKYDIDRESPNWVVHMSATDYEVQVFGIILAGYDIIEKMSVYGVHGGSEPKVEWIIENCGELCTLDKNKLTTLPWNLYESVSDGYDAFKFGPEADPSLLVPPSMLASYRAREAANGSNAGGGLGNATAGGGGGASWWRRILAGK